MVTVRSVQVGEGLASVHRLEERHVEHVDAVGVARIRDHVREVPGALPDLVVAAGARPGRTAVVRTEQAARVRLHQGPHAIVAHGRDREADLADDTLWKAAAPGDVLPRVPAIGRLPEDRKSTRLNSSHMSISYAVFCLKTKNHSTAFAHRPVYVSKRVVAH